MPDREAYYNARKIFAGTKYEATEDDIRRLAVNMGLLKERGLDNLNKRLFDSGRKIWNTIAEHNFAVMLLSQHDATIPIKYEPSELVPPPDFKVVIGGVTYWIQMKDLAMLERENRQDKIVQRIKTDAKKIKVGKFFSCTLSDDFKEDCLSELMNFLREKAESSSEGAVFIFTSTNNQKAEIKLWTANNSKLSELTLGSSGDLEMVEITGLARDQIRKSLCNATGAFTWPADDNNINLIVLEADNKEDIDICDAVFGTEHLIVGGVTGWGRYSDGLFSQSDFSGKVAGVIAIKRKPEKWELSSEEGKIADDFAEKCNMTSEEYREQIKRNAPISDYYRILYMNDRVKHLREGIERQLITLNSVVSYDMRPPMGKGNFESS